MHKWYDLLNNTDLITASLPEKPSSTEYVLYYTCFITHKNTSLMLSYKELMCSGCYFYWDFIHFLLFYPFPNSPSSAVSVKNFNIWSLETKSPYPPNWIFSILLIIQLLNHIAAGWKVRRSCCIRQALMSIWL